MPVDGTVHPGRSVADAVTAGGVRHGSTTAFAGGIVTRGILLDLAPGDRLPAPHPITSVDLDKAEERSGIEVLPGDAVVVRSGRGFSWDADDQAPGMTIDAVA